VQRRPATAAAHLCSEQSTAQWKRVDVDEDYRPRFGAKVVRPGAGGRAVGHQLRARSAGVRSGQRLPRADRPSAPQLRSAAAEPDQRGARRGRLFRAGHAGGEAAGYRVSRQLSGRLPGAAIRHRRLRALWDIHDRPFFFGVIKPNIGLPPEPFAELAYQAWLGGLDIAKDDEMLADPDWSPLAERSALLGAAGRDRNSRPG
jgi:ribulose-bisphosphate carboxylase large chain